MFDLITVTLNDESIVPSIPVLLPQLPFTFHTYTRYFAQLSIVNAQFIFVSIDCLQSYQPL